MRNGSTKAPAGLKGGAGRLEAELGTALTTVSFFQGAVQHADDKVRTVVAVQTMITAMVTAQAGLFGAPRPASVPRCAVFAVLLCFAIAYAYSSFHLVQAFRPRTRAPSARNRFAFPSVAAGTADPVLRTVRDQCAQAHELAGLLAALALRKHRHLRSALAGTCVLFAGGLGMLVLTALS